MVHGRLGGVNGRRQELKRMHPLIACKARSGVVPRGGNRLPLTKKDGGSTIRSPEEESSSPRIDRIMWGEKKERYRLAGSKRSLAGLGHCMG